MAKDWKTYGREGSTYLKFQDGEEKDLQFVAGPEEHTFKAKDGSTVTAFEWAVLVDEGEKILSVSSKRLLSVLADEDDDEPLIGRGLRIKAMGGGYNRQWRVRSIANPTKTKRTVLSMEEEIELGDDEQCESTPAQSDASEEKKKKAFARRVREHSRKGKSEEGPI